MPCEAAVPIATDVAVPPERFSVIEFADEFALTVADTAPATGTISLTFSVYPREPENGALGPVELSVATIWKL
ncbi:hypothetical protein D9M68_502770 [compost metagenome]